MVKTSPFYAGGAGSIPDQGTKNPTCLTALKNQNTRVSIVTNSIKILKMAHIKKKNLF